jgi:hypothetical protein
MEEAAALVLGRIVTLVLPEEMAEEHILQVLTLPPMDLTLLQELVAELAEEQVVTHTQLREVEEPQELLTRHIIS